jgi:hypothetical protein
MLEDAGPGDGARLAMLVLHGDATREMRYGPARCALSRLDQLSQPLAGMGLLCRLLSFLICFA